MGIPPASSICIIKEVPDRGNPETITTKLDIFACISSFFLLLGSSMSSSSSDETQGLSKQLDSGLNRHFLACAAFVGTATLITAQRADGSIVYSGPMNLPVPATNNFGGVYID